MAGPPSASAHPHVFVDYAVVLVLGSDGLTSVQVTWTFDEMFSSLLLESAKAGRGRALSAAESQAIERRHFLPLRSDQFFLDIRMDGRPVRVDSVRDFRASFVDDRVTYTFVVPIGARNPRDGTLEIRVDDPTYYIAFDPQAESPVRWSASPTYAVSCRVVPSSGSFESTAIQCTYRRRTP